MQNQKDDGNTTVSAISDHPAGTQSLSIDDARHVLQRSGFAETPATVVQLAQQSRSQVLTTLLTNTQPIAARAAPDWVHDYSQVFPDVRKLEKPARRKVRKQFRMQQRQQISELKAWWIASLIGNQQSAGRTHHIILAEPFHLAVSQGTCCPLAVSTTSNTDVACNGAFQRYADSHIA